MTVAAVMVAIPGNSLRIADLSCVHLGECMELCQVPGDFYPSNICLIGELIGVVVFKG
jgi:hypothetical protein